MMLLHDYRNRECVYRINGCCRFQFFCMLGCTNLVFVFDFTIRFEAGPYLHVIA